VGQKVNPQKAFENYLSTANIPKKIDKMLIAIRINHLFDTLDFGAAHRVGYKVDEAISRGRLAEADLILRRLGV
jgi:hypothetical protein